MNQSSLTAIIVDDEALAREGLLLRLKEIDKIAVVGSFASATEAQLSYENLMPDVVFLDIEMPGISGLEFAQWIQSQGYDTRIVFVTAFKEFALNAFDFEAFDYLLKPYAEDRLATCVGKLIIDVTKDNQASEQERLNSLLINKTGNSLSTFMDQLEKAEPGKLSEQKDTISLKSGTQWLKIKLHSINWVEAAGDYMCIHTKDGTHIVRKTMKELQDSLCQASFATTFKRASRSAIINTNLLFKLSPNSNGEYIAELSSGDKIKVSRNYKEDILPIESE